MPAAVQRQKVGNASFLQLFGYVLFVTSTGVDGVPLWKRLRCRRRIRDWCSHCRQHFDIRIDPSRRHFGLGHSELRHLTYICKWEIASLSRLQVSVSMAATPAA